MALHLHGVMRDAANADDMGGQRPMEQQMAGRPIVVLRSAADWVDCKVEPGIQKRKPGRAYRQLELLAQMSI